jgi:hypothetical protein
MLFHWVFSAAAWKLPRIGRTFQPVHTRANAMMSAFVYVSMVAPLASSTCTVPASGRRKHSIERNRNQAPSTSRSQAPAAAKHQPQPRTTSK